MGFGFTNLPLSKKGRNNRNLKIQTLIQSYAREASRKLGKKREIEIKTKSENRERNERVEKKGSGRGKCGIAARLCTLVSARNKTKSQMGQIAIDINVDVSVCPFARRVLFIFHLGVHSYLGEYDVSQMTGGGCISWESLFLLQNFRNTRLICVWFTNVLRGSHVADVQYKSSHSVK